MKLFFRYLRDRCAALLVVALCLGICAVVFSLFQLPVYAVGYAALLCGAVDYDAAAGLSKLDNQI